MGIESVLSALRPEPVVELSTPEPVRSRLTDLIERARNRPLFTMPVELAVGDVLVEIVFSQVRPAGPWMLLKDSHPPRPGVAQDRGVGYDVEAVTGLYPEGSLTVDGDAVTAEAWSELWGLLDAATRSDLAAAAWAVNEGMPAEQLRALVAKEKEKRNA
ncbi:hypothetical protein [Microbacterium lacus]|uniref:Uncharacterized protein n=1 Tax=Microbacterium lacus TaxID=415217 RepID=A0ABN2GW67_9MICO